MFRSPSVLAAALIEHHRALVGEVRVGPDPTPGIQASFVMPARDVLGRRDVPTPLHHGSPTYALQRSIARPGRRVADLPTYRSGLLVHRGRAGVAAAVRHRPRNQHAALANDHPPSMGVPGGARMWAEEEERHANVLGAGAEDEFRGPAGSAIAVLGTAVVEVERVAAVSAADAQVTRRRRHQARRPW